MDWKIKRDYNSLKILDKEGEFLAVKIENGRITISKNNSSHGYGADGFLEKYEFSQNSEDLIKIILDFRAQKMQGIITLKEFYSRLNDAFDTYQMLNEFIAEKYIEID